MGLLHAGGRSLILRAPIRQPQSVPIGVCRQGVCDRLILFLRFDALSGRLGPKWLMVGRIHVCVHNSSQEGPPTRPPRREPKKPPDRRKRGEGVKEREARLADLARDCLRLCSPIRHQPSVRDLPRCSACPPKTARPPRAMLLTICGVTNFAFLPD